MTDAPSPGYTRTSKVIKAPREALDRAFTDRMSLFYPSSGQVYHGKTSDREDRFTARFVELTPPTRIVQAITFNSADPAYSGEMTFVATFEVHDGGTEVTVECKHIPSGIRPEDNQTGCRSSLEKLARYIE